MTVRLDIFAAIEHGFLLEFADAAREDGVPPTGWIDYIAVLTVTKQTASNDNAADQAGRTGRLPRLPGGPA
ncbi:hypothetical protein LK533_08060 [Sphingomonas sp. PL-96]|uniref:hypothetical protein n=1 Tax=Sphingomonas sp. PL-96 TaxID=2887201 RepID=UPI001E2994D9|nr:hypothetical protein [Sphingomonas sp. PL-96]MCC2976628.1 hypothetical protein [Sphingomonas sp. PL-96]